MLTLDADPKDARRRLVRLTAGGRAALAAGSVLDPARLAAVLGGMEAEERRRAVEGLGLLAAAARAWREEKG
jgi:DNA-binding MarR family transcriptional regulator